MAKKEDRKQQKKRRKEEKKRAAWRQVYGRLRNLTKKLSVYPEVDYFEDEGDPAFVAIVKKAQREIDLDNPDECPDLFRSAYRCMREQGFPAAQHLLGEAVEPGPEQKHMTAVIQAVFLQHYGQAIFNRIPEDVRKAYLPYNDVFVNFVGNRLALVFSSLLTARGAGGTIYYSRRKPSFTVNGQPYTVGFSKHAIEQVVTRLKPSYLNYGGAGDVHAFLANCLYYEPAILDSHAHPNQEAFCMYDMCGTPECKTYHTYVDVIYGLNGREPDYSRGQFYYRMGYFPVAIDNGFAKAVTFMLPGYTGTPERRLLNTTKMPHKLKNFLMAEASEHTGREVLVEDRDEVIKWFHHNGIPQVRQFSNNLFDSTPRMPAASKRRAGKVSAR